MKFSIFYINLTTAISNDNRETSGTIIKSIKKLNEIWILETRFNPGFRVFNWV